MKKRRQKEFRIEKIINRKCYRLYIKQKGFDNLFNSYNDMNDI